MKWLVINKKQLMHVCLLASFFCLYSAEFPAQGIATSIIKMDLLISVKVIKIIPIRHGQRFISQVITDSIKLKVDYCSSLPCRSVLKAISFPCRVRSIRVTSQDVICILV